MRRGLQMKQTFKIALLVFVGLVLQIALIARMSLFGSRPDLPLVLIVAVALLKGPFHGELVGFVSGFLIDLLSGGPMGIQAFSGAVIGYCAGFVRGRLYPENLITQAASVFVATLVGKAITSVHLSLLFTDTQFLRISFLGSVLVALINSIFVVIIFWILKKLIRDEI
jgi:rod shape-determining protein MreD